MNIEQVIETYKDDIPKLIEELKRYKNKELKDYIDRHSLVILGNNKNGYIKTIVQSLYIGQIIRTGKI